MIELMATVLLLGLVITGLLAALITLVASSDAFNKSSRTNLAVHEYAESLKAPLNAAAYQPCATTTTYPAFAASPTGYTATVVSVAVWKGTMLNSAPVFETGACSAAQDKGLQQITVRVVSSSQPPRRATETVVLVKRDQRCQVSYDNADGKPC